MEKECSVKKAIDSMLSGKPIRESIALCESEEPDEEKVRALLQFLDLEDSEENRARIFIAPWNDDVYCIDSDRNDFRVYTDEEADQAFADSIENLVDELGIEAFAPNAQSYILENFVDEDEILDYFRDDMESYAQDIINEENSPKEYTIEDENGEDVTVECSNRLFQECEDAGIIDLSDLSPDDFENGDYVGDLDLVELYCDHFADPEDLGYDSAADWYKFNFGADALKRFIRDNDAWDLDGLVEYLKNEDGRGNELNGYDGKEYDEDVDGNTYYIYPNCDFETIGGSDD